MKKFLWHYIIVVCIGLFFSIVFVATAQENTEEVTTHNVPVYNEYTHPLIIDVMRRIDYTGSEIIVEETLPNGINHERYIVSYLSENKKIYGLLAIPKLTRPKSGSPAVVLAHGYIPPNEYITESMYPELIDALAENGFVVFMPDFRGHGKSDGIAEGAYFSPGYTIDYLNAIASISRYNGVDSENIGAWGHSMGGNIVLRTLVVNKQIKSAVIWSGVVGSYTDLLFHWSSRTVWNTSYDTEVIRPEDISQQFGTINENGAFWEKISPFSYLNIITAPVQLHHAIDDPIVPHEFSSKLNGHMKLAGKSVELYDYESADHDLLDADSQGSVFNTVKFFENSLR